MFVDASAIIAIITFEDDKLPLSQKLQDARYAIISPVVIYETILGLRRKTSCDVEAARSFLDRFIANAKAEIMPINVEIGLAALYAHEKFGKGRHRAALNMGDSFAYACAKSRRVPLLCKGDNFIHTDIEIA